VVAVREALVSQDEGPRPDTSAEGLAKLRPVFRNGGSVTAATARRCRTAPAGVLLASESAIKEYGLKPAGAFVGYAVAGVKPE
jgi:acetyl-CoA acyltransferase